MTSKSDKASSLGWEKPGVRVVVGVVATLVIAVAVVIVLQRTGDDKAVSDNAALIGAVIALGGVFTTQLVSIALDDRRATETRDFEDRRATETRDLEDRRAQDIALQAFLDQIAHSDTYRELRTAPASGHKRAILRAKLQTLLLHCNAERKGVLLSFLHGAKLSRKKEITPYEYTRKGRWEKGKERWKYPILRLNDIDFSLTKRTADTKLTFDDLRGIILRGAKLSKVNLSGANLSDADLSDADLSQALLRKATPEDSEKIPGESQNEYEKAKAGEATTKLLKTDLSRANLRGANLSGADLSGADLSGADLSGANLFEATGITTKELEDQALSLKGATMPDGSKHS
jgi:uncharacterized protein YjbI with pentapeptide repeats